MMSLNSDRLAAVIQAAFDKAQGSLRWERAIVRAKRQLESNPFMSLDGDALLILSDSNVIYRANGACQCKAYLSGQPCWHRAAARIVARYHETRHQ